MGELPNKYGRTKLVDRYRNLFDFFDNYVKPEKHKLLDLQADERKKRKALEKAEGKTTFQNSKVNRAYELQEHFKK